MKYKVVYKIDNQLIEATAELKSNEFNYSFDQIAQPMASDTLSDFLSLMNTIKTYSTRSKSIKEISITPKKD